MCMRARLLSFMVSVGRGAFQLLYRVLPERAVVVRSLRARDVVNGYDKITDRLS